MPTRSLLHGNRFQEHQEVSIASDLCLSRHVVNSKTVPVSHGNMFVWLCSSGRQCPHMMAHASIRQNAAWTVVGLPKSSLVRLTLDELTLGILVRAWAARGLLSTVRCLWIRGPRVQIICTLHIRSAGGRGERLGRELVSCTTFPMVLHVDK